VFFFFFKEAISVPFVTKSYMTFQSLNPMPASETVVESIVKKSKYPIPLYRVIHPLVKLQISNEDLIVIVVVSS